MSTGQHGGGFLVQPIEERRAIVAEVMQAVCKAADVSIDLVLAPRSTRRQVVPRRAVAVAMREVLGWSVRHVLMTCGVSRALLFYPSDRHLADPMFKVCREVACAAAEKFAPAAKRARMTAASIAAARAAEVRQRITAAIRRAAEEHRLRPEVLATDRASRRTNIGRRIAEARRAAITESLAAGATRREIADVLGIWPETVSRIISGRLH